MPHCRSEQAGTFLIPRRFSKHKRLASIEKAKAASDRRSEEERSRCPLPRYRTQRRGAGSFRDAPQGRISMNHNVFEGLSSARVILWSV
eukprot:scaffold90391_cov83-Cyclotella_meneghiniana.AAC.1